MLQREGQGQDDVIPKVRLEAAQTMSPVTKASLALEDSATRVCDVQATRLRVWDRLLEVEVVWTLEEAIRPDTTWVKISIDDGKCDFVNVQGHLSGGELRYDAVAAVPSPAAAPAQVRGRGPASDLPL